MPAIVRVRKIRITFRATSNRPLLSTWPLNLPFIKQYSRPFYFWARTETLGLFLNDRSIRQSRYYLNLDFVKDFETLEKSTFQLIFRFWSVNFKSVTVLCIERALTFNDRFWLFWAFHNYLQIKKVLKCSCHVQERSTLWKFCKIKFTLTLQKWKIRCT